jgi:hypothetical protein
VIGGSGCLDELSLLGLYAQAHKPRAAEEYALVEYLAEFRQWARMKAEGMEIGETDYLIGYDGTAWHVIGFAIMPVIDHHAIGAGEDFARAALHGGKSAKEAVAVACELSPWCERPINTIRMKRAGSQ